MTASPSARARRATRCEPEPRAVARTTRSGPTQRTGMSCARPGGVVQPSSATAGHVGRSTSASPRIRSSAGRTNISNDANELTGLPGSV